MKFAVWISVLALLTAIAPLATDMYLPAFPTVATDLGTTPSGVQLTLTAFLVGLALGQLVIGPLSDGWGRRRLLIAGTAVCAVAGVLVALAPSVEIAVIARFVQGFGGAAGIVLSRAVIVDRTTGTRTASLFAVMMAISGVAPIVAPLLGSGLLVLIGWRGIFLVLAGLGAVMLIGVLVAIPESLPAEKRRGGGLSRTVHDIGSVLRRRRYLGFTLAYAFSFASMFAYISGSPFVLQDVLHLSPTMFALVFGANSVGLVVTSMLAARASRRFAPVRQLVFGVAGLLVMTVALLVVVLAGAPMWPGPGAAVPGRVDHRPDRRQRLRAGHRRGLRDRGHRDPHCSGALQFAISAVVSPVVGSSAITMAVTMVVAAVLAAVALLLVRGGTPAPAAREPEAVLDSRR